MSSTIQKNNNNNNNNNNSHNNNQKNSSNFHNTQYHKKNDLVVDYKYICIKKDFFDVNMINLNYKNLKYNNYIEIIYKTPCMLLEGIYFKTPVISSNNISVYHKERYMNNISIKLLLNQKEHPQFIQILRSIDEYISSYINKFAVEINNELQDENENDTRNDTNDNGNGNGNGNDGNYKIYKQYSNISRSVSMLTYEQIIKYNVYKHNTYRYNGSGSSGGNGNGNTSENESYHIYLKSYLDKDIISDLENNSNKKYIFTFNISNIYISNNSLTPLIKCNRCEVVE